MMRKFAVLGILLLLLLGSLAYLRISRTERMYPGDLGEVMVVGGLRRTYIVHFPRIFLRMTTCPS